MADEVGVQRETLTGLDTRASSQSSLSTPSNSSDRRHATTEFSTDQQKALARIQDYPRRLERLRSLWISVHPPSQQGETSRRSSMSVSSSVSSTVSRLGGPLSSTPSRLARVGRAAVFAGKGSRRQPTAKDSDSDFEQIARAGPLIAGALTVAQIRELVTREITPEDYEMLLLLDEGVKKANTLSAEVVANLPQPIGDTWQDEECRICLGAMEAGANVRMLPPCGHIYHASCAERWLATSRSNCPMCATEVVI